MTCLATEHAQYSNGSRGNMAGEGDDDEYEELAQKQVLGYVNCLLRGYA